MRRESFLTLAANNSFNINPYDLTQNPTNKTPGGLLGLPSTGASGSWIGTPNVPQQSPYFGYLKLPPMYPQSNGLYAEAGGAPPYASYTAQGAWTTWTLFAQQNVSFDDRYGVNAGFSQSYVNAGISNPAIVSATDNYHDEEDYKLYSIQVSPYFKPTADSTVYVTYDHSVDLNTGGFENVLTWGPGNKLNPLSFHSLSDLLEIGAKAEPLPRQLFASLVGFWQARDTSPDTNGNIARLETHGIEASARYQPDALKNFASGVNLSWIQSRYSWIIPSGFSPFGFYTDNATVWGDSNVLNQRQGGAYDAAGLPHYTATAYVNYHFDWGLGAELAGWWTSSWYTNLSYTVKVPAEYNLDLRVYYHQPSWDVSVAALNLTDQKNFVNGLAGSTSEFLQPMRPLSLQAQAAYRF